MHRCVICLSASGVMYVRNVSFAVSSLSSSSTSSY
jgi:hypothetical protein